MRYDNKVHCKYHNDTVNLCGDFLRPITFANHYLLKKSKISLQKQVRQIQGMGIFINKSTYYRIKNGTYKNVYLNLIMYYCHYWDKHIVEMYELGMRVINKEIE